MVAKPISSHRGEMDANPERGVPTFDNEVKNYREYRLRAELYARRMKNEDKESSACLNLISGLTGKAWSAVEPMLADMSKLEGKEAWKALLLALDTAFKHDARTEMPDRFEDFFYRHARRPKETLMDYITR